MSDRKHGLPLGPAVCQAALAIVFLASGIPAAFAQNPAGPGPGRAAAAGVPANAEPKGGGRPARGLADHSGVSIAVPIGTVTIGPGQVEGEPRYPNRTKVRPGITVVEMSDFPVEIAAGSGQPAFSVAASAVAPEAMPAGW